MAVDFGKVSINALYSEDARHSNQRARFSPTPFEFSPDECLTATLGLSPGDSPGGPKVLHSGFGSSTHLLAIKNPGLVGVQVVWWSLQSTTAMGAGHTLTFNNSAKTVTRSGSGAPDLHDFSGGGDYVLFSGAINSSNEGPFLATDVSASAFTLKSSYTLVDEGVLEVIVKVLKKNSSIIPAGGMLVVCDALNDQDIRAASVSGDTEIEYIVMGA